MKPRFEEHSGHQTLNYVQAMMRISDPAAHRLHAAGSVNVHMLRAGARSGSDSSRPPGKC